MADKIPSFQIIERAIDIFPPYCYNIDNNYYLQLQIVFYQIQEYDTNRSGYCSYLILFLYTEVILWLEL